MEKVQCGQQVPMGLEQSVSIGVRFQCSLYDSIAIGRQVTIVQDPMTCLTFRNMLLSYMMVVMSANLDLTP